MRWPGFRPGIQNQSGRWLRITLTIDVVVRVSQAEQRTRTSSGPAFGSSGSGAENSARLPSGSGRFT
jgi:hypothetical protein